MSNSKSGPFSLKREVAELVDRMPQLDKASKASRRAARESIARSVTGAQPGEPVTIEQARRQLEQVAADAVRAAAPAGSRAYGVRLRPAPGSKKAKTRLGRGEGSEGKTASRVAKGTKARYALRTGFEGGQIPLHMRTRKLRGFKSPFREYQVVNLQKLVELYPKGGDVTVADLVAKGAVRKNEKVKVLGSGDIAVKLNVAVDKVAGSAEQKIVAAGGTVE